MSTKHSASILRSMGLDDDTIRAAILKGTCTDDVGLTGASPNNLIYVAGEPDHKVSNTDFIDHLEQVIRQRAAVLERQQAELDEKLILISSN